MKKLIIAFTAALFFIPVAYAATAESPADMLVGDTDMFMVYDFAKPNVLESSMMGILTKKFGENSNTIFENKKITFASNTWEGTNYLMFECKASDFNALTSQYWTKQNYNNYTVAEENNKSTYATFTGTYCIFTNSEYNINSIIDYGINGSIKALSSSPAYKNFMAKIPADSFLTTFTNPSYSNELSEIYSPVLAAITGQGYSFSQDDAGFNIYYYSEGDAAKMAEIDFSFDENNFIPKLYTKISGNKLIGYFGGNNLAGSLMDTINILSVTNGAILESGIDELNTMFGMDFKTELLPVFSGEWMFAMHDSGTSIPGFTMVFNVNSNLSQAQSGAFALNEKIKETFEAAETEQQREFYSYSTKTIQDTDFTEHKFATPEVPDADPFYLYIGVSADGLFVVSTNPDLASIYKTDSGLTVNQGFKSNFTNPSESIKNIIYFDIENLKSYMTGIMKKSGTDEEFIASIIAPFEPWHYFYAKIHSNSNQEWGDFLISADTNDIENIGDMFNNYSSSLWISKVQFCDVTQDDWFEHYVTGLADKGVVRGYPDGCFKPGNEITRAEFVKMAFLQKGYPLLSDNFEKQVFTDINGEEWYAIYIDSAYFYKFIKGYGDGTFKPNDPITRAEAMQIISNFNDSYSLMKEMYSNIESNFFDANGEEPFTDVNETDWFYDAVRYAYLMGTISGSEDFKFNPYRNLTRAEAAKILMMGI